MEGQQAVGCLEELTGWWGIDVVSMISVCLKTGSPDDVVSTEVRRREGGKKGKRDE